MGRPTARVMICFAMALPVTWVSGCRRETGGTASASPAGNPEVCAPGPGACGATAKGAARSGPTANRDRPARLVFIDLEKSCPCTQRRIASSWKALTAVLGTSPSIPLDRFHLDTQDTKAEPYVDKRPMMVAPGLYVLDQRGNIIDLLQGDITEAQLRGVIR